MDDRELLALAAKAIGARQTDHSDRTPDQWVMYRHDGAWYPWTPLFDDGDALRLAATLGINIDFEDCSAWKRTPNDLIEAYWGGDCHPCYRHAIVRAAAEIGRKIP